MTESLPSLIARAGHAIDAPFPSSNAGFVFLAVGIIELLWQLMVASIMPHAVAWVMPSDIQQRTLDRFAA